MEQAHQHAAATCCGFVFKTEDASVVTIAHHVVPGSVIHADELRIGNALHARFLTKAAERCRGSLRRISRLCGLMNTASPRPRLAVSVRNRPHMARLIRRVDPRPC